MGAHGIFRDRQRVQQAISEEVWRMQETLRQKGSLEPYGEWPQKSRDLDFTPKSMLEKTLVAA